MRKIQVAFLGIVIGILILAGCTVTETLELKESATPNIVPSSAQTEQRTEYIRIWGEEALAMMSEDVVVLDICTQEEYEEGHIKNAIMLHDYEVKEKAESILTDKNQTILVYCRKDANSVVASIELINMGYKNVYDFGNLENWPDDIVGNWLYPSYYNYFGQTLPPDIVTTIDFMTTEKIGVQMPEFTFHLAGNTVESYGISHGGTRYYRMHHDNEIETITITDKAGNLVQKIDGLVTENPASEEEMFGFSFGDWNFDGYMDISLWAYRGGSMRNNPHYYWLWDENAGQFVENTQLMDMSDMSTISINAETKQLECYTRFGGYGYLTSFFEYLENEFKLVYAIEVETFSNPNEKGKYVTRTIIKKLINGKLVTTEDYYENVDK